MKKLTFFMLLLAIVCYVPAFAQSEQEESNGLESLNILDGFSKVEYIEVAKIQGRSSIVKIEVVLITDLTKNLKSSYAQLTTYSSSSLYSSPQPHIGILNHEELQSFIDCCKYIKDNLLQTTPERHTEVLYNTQQGKIRVGALYEPQDGRPKWNIFVQTTQFSNSIEFLNQNKINELIEALDYCKKFISLQKGN